MNPALWENGVTPAPPAPPGNRGCLDLQGKRKPRGGGETLWDLGWGGGAHKAGLGGGGGGATL